jgi:hypothetical protein
MTQVYVLTGQLESARSLALDEPLPLERGRVRVTVQPLGEKNSPDASSRVLSEIWEANARAGRVPPSKEEVDSFVDSERASWE